MRAGMFVLIILIVGTVGFYCLPVTVWAEKVSNVSETLHNLSATGAGSVKATDAQSTEICVFCHTPHGATSFPGAPLWNRDLGSSTYTPYTSASLDAATIMGGSLGSPAGSSKLCLSCHDGTLALGTVNVAGGQTNFTFNMSTTTMPGGPGSLTGFTRNLGTSLTNDHPISLTFNTSVANADGELFDPATAGHIGTRAPGVRPLIPLEPTGAGGEGQIQCATCHDPHLYDAAATSSIKFLRLNRFQQGPAAEGSFTQANDMLCLACHDKPGWATSAHAIASAANETYISTPPNLREIPVGMPVWQAGCLNCHDTHTVHGARRLLREGTDSLTTPKSGGNSAIEETCYQCHSSTPIITNASNEVPDIKTDFSLLRHMPITASEQPAITPEVHDIIDGNFNEARLNLGFGDANNRHTECTDCHNPHRLMKDQLFSGNSGNTTEGTHAHVSGHSNIASGVLRGSLGVEPTYSSSNFLSLPSGYTIKQGDGGIGASNAVTNTWVTREYQVCLKCHSDYGYTDNNIYPIGSRPSPGTSGGTTPSGTNNLLQYSNQAMEFQAPATQKGAPASNYRSWHPVMDNTGRTPAIRTMTNSAGTTNLFLTPWNGLANVGNQTMYCSDCHGSNTVTGTVVPAGNNPWGPHGSTNDFLLKGPWNNTVGSGAGGTGNNGFCFRCHNYTNYATDANEGSRNGFESGFGGSRDSNLHAFHAKQLGNRIRCNWCHIAVPHGWKNKAFLVNLNDVGAEAGLAGTEVAITTNATFYNQGPYYLNAKLKVITFAASGNWEDTNCGSASGQQGTGRDWMRNVCDPPGGP